MVALLLLYPTIGYKHEDTHSAPVFPSASLYAPGLDKKQSPILWRAQASFFNSTQMYLFMLDTAFREDVSFESCSPPLVLGICFSLFSIPICCCCSSSGSFLLLLRKERVGRHTGRNEEFISAFYLFSFFYQLHKHEKLKRLGWEASTRKGERKESMVFVLVFSFFFFFFPA